MTLGTTNFVIEFYSLLYVSCCYCCLGWVILKQMNVWSLRPLMGGKENQVGEILQRKFISVSVCWRPSWNLPLCTLGIVQQKHIGKGKHQHLYQQTHRLRCLKEELRRIEAETVWCPDLCPGRDAKDLDTPAGGSGVCDTFTLGLSLRHTRAEIWLWHCIISISMVLVLCYILYYV